MSERSRAMNYIWPTTLNRPTPSTHNNTELLYIQSYRGRKRKVGGQEEGGNEQKKNVKQIAKGLSMMSNSACIESGIKHNTTGHDATGK